MELYVEILLSILCKYYSQFAFNRFFYILGLYQEKIDTTKLPNSEVGPSVILPDLGEGCYTENVTLPIIKNELDDDNPSEEIQNQSRQSQENISVVFDEINLEDPLDIKEEPPKVQSVWGYKCTVCNITFEEKDNLTNHISTVHEGKKFVQTRGVVLKSTWVFQCNICQEEFSSKPGIMDHVKTIHQTFVDLVL